LVALAGVALPLVGPLLLEPDVPEPLDPDLGVDEEQAEATSARATTQAAIRGLRTIAPAYHALPSS
jgi:hypothetical protein